MALEIPKRVPRVSPSVVRPLPLPPPLSPFSSRCNRGPGIRPSWARLAIMARRVRANPIWSNRRARARALMAAQPPRWAAIRPGAFFAHGAVAPQFCHERPPPRQLVTAEPAAQLSNWRLLAVRSFALRLFYGPRLICCCSACNALADHSTKPPSVGNPLVPRSPCWWRTRQRAPCLGDQRVPGGDRPRRRPPRGRRAGDALFGRPPSRRRTRQRTLFRGRHLRSRGPPAAWRPTHGRRTGDACAKTRGGVAEHAGRRIRPSQVRPLTPDPDPLASKKK